MSILEHLSLGGDPAAAQGPAGSTGSTARSRAAGLEEAKTLNLAALDRQVSTLSGGNIQRVLYTRLVAARRRRCSSPPTRAAASTSPPCAPARSCCSSAGPQGCGVLLISEDLDELFELSDRIVVLHDGEVAGIVKPTETTRRAVGHLMLGSAAA